MITFWFSIFISFFGSPRGCICEGKQDSTFGRKEQGGKDNQKDFLQNQQADSFLSWAQEFLKSLSRLGSCSYSVDGK